MAIKGSYLKIRKNGQRVPYLPDTVVSSNLQKLLTILIDKGKVDQSIYNMLSNDEKDLVEHLIGGYSHERYNQDEINKLIERYNIIKGEILIGNDSPDLLRELKVTVLSLVKYNILDLKQITPILQYLFLLM